MENRNGMPVLGSPDFPMDQCLKILASDASTTDKKEAMSSIGRKRDIRNKWALMHYTKDNNPEVALQAVRGLLVFRSDPDIKKHLKALCDHPNDMVRDVVRNEASVISISFHSGKYPWQFSSINVSCFQK